MSKRIKLTGILLVLVLAVSSQQMWNYPEVDKKSYELFQQQKWTELIDFTDEARSNGIDYFYLQARTGIAYFNLKKYRKASDYFLKAWENDQSFEWLQEYLYYGLVYAGRTPEALKYAQNFTENLQQKIGFTPKKLTRIAVEAGYSFNPDIDDLTQAEHYEMAGVGDDYGEAFYLENYHFESVDVSHRVAPGVSINHSFTYLGINREEQVYWGELTTFPIKNKQMQYFVNPVFVAGDKWYVSTSANLIWGDYSYYAGGFNKEKYFYNGTVYFRDLVFTASTWFHSGNFAPGIEIDYANFNNEGFGQYSAWVTYYPLSNLNLYFTPRIYFKSDKENGFGYNTFGFSGGAQMGPFHFTGQYLRGDMVNFIEPAGYVAGNFPGRSEQKIAGSLYFPAGKKYQFVLRYINQDVFEMYNVYTGGVISNSMEYKYIKHTLTAGISWNF
jgi:tetratricopeptide (TPR) repeat protein